MARTRELLTKKAFVKWLESKPADEDVGQAGDTECCPIATYLTDVFPKVDCVDVNENEINVYRQLNGSPDINVETPQWARNFIETVDDIHTNVTALDALDLLR